MKTPAKLFFRKTQGRLSVYNGADTNEIKHVMPPTPAQYWPVLRTCGVVMVSAADLASPAGFWAHYNRPYSYTYLHVIKTASDNGNLNAC